MIALVGFEPLLASTKDSGGPDEQVYREIREVRPLEHLARRQAHRGWFLLQGGC